MDVASCRTNEPRPRSTLRSGSTFMLDARANGLLAGTDPLSCPVQYGCQLRGDRSWNSRMITTIHCGGVVTLDPHYSPKGYVSGMPCNCLLSSGLTADVRS